jgi:hypothetical protein
MTAAAGTLLWKAGDGGQFGYSGVIPVAVVRPLSAALTGPWTWTLLVGPPQVLQGFEAAGERPTLSAAKDKAQHAWAHWCSMADVISCQN